MMINKNELEKIDIEFMADFNAIIVPNICNILKCKQEDISNICILANGRTNTSFAFYAKGQQYVYRHPGKQTERYIDRQSEHFACKKVAELGIDKSFIYMDPITGFKLSRYITETRVFDFKNLNDIKNGVELLKKLHRARITSPYEFDHIEQIKALYRCMGDSVLQRAYELDALYQQVVELDTYVKADGWPKCLIHGDPKDANIMISGDDYILIDWEYAGNKDIGYDISHFAAEIGRARCNGRWELSRDDAAWYFDGSITEEQYRHIVACFAIEEFFWTVWAINKDKKDITERCYQNARHFGKEALALYE